MINDDNDEIPILSVKQERKSRKLFQLYDGGEEPFLIVHEDIFIRFRLMKGAVVTRQQVAEIADEDMKYRAYIAAIAYLSTKPRTSKEIALYLGRKELEPLYIEHAVKRLSHEGYLDDESYAKQFASGRLRNGGKGRMLIKQELQQRGVSKQAAVDALAELSQEEELAAALAAGQKKWRTMKGDSDDKKRKLMGYLLRRGYPGPIVREVLKELQQGDEAALSLDDDMLMLDN